MPQYLREVLAANECTTAYDMAVAADRRRRRHPRGLPTPRAVRLAAPARPQLRPQPLSEPSAQPSPDTSHTGIPQ
jgi:hypothetical protein